MIITGLRTRCFRNLGDIDLNFTQGGIFFLGSNGQGKTNLLEALGLVTALRSFRTQDMRSLMRWKSAEPTVVLVRVEHPLRGECEVEIRMESGQRTVMLDGEPIRRLADFLGLFPTVAFTSQDIQLLRGAPQLRRRFLDLAISAVDPVYFEALRDYHRVLKERNALLKKRMDMRMAAPFEKVMATTASRILEIRHQALDYLNEHLQSSYRVISPEEESPELVYRPSGDWSGSDDFLKLLESNRSKDLQRETTTVGPHRDDFVFRLRNHRAREFASEGQQRGLALALRLAQVQWIYERHQIYPVILADDILGELDPVRQNGFWKSLQDCPQIFATGTRMPDKGVGVDWQLWNIKDGEPQIKNLR